MYRLLVVDDEELITDSMADMLRETTRFELDVYKAYSAKEAIRLLNESAFDIVVTDICMPGMSGLELLRIIREKWPFCQVIFQTGYDTFDYAKQAMQQKVVHYILKNEGDDVLLDAIAECIQEKEKDADMRAMIQKGRSEAQILRMILKKNLLYEAMCHHDTAPEKSSGDFQQAGISLDLQQPSMLLAARSSEMLNDELTLAVDVIVREKIAYAVNSEIVWSRENTVVWIVQSRTLDDCTYAIAAIKGMAESIQRSAEQALSMDISFVFQSDRTQWDQLSCRFRILRHIAQHQLNPRARIALAGVEYFQSGNSTATPDIEKDLSTGFINRLLQYISGHLAEDLSLSALSDNVHLNSSYLSRRFKELTGSTLSETITEMRIRKACELLETTSERVNAIGSSVGYDSAANFSKAFKKALGCTPQAYRDRHNYTEWPQGLKVVKKDQQT